jgi:hypothetical protein
MSKRSTHRGSCQLCGHVQKLPAGRLSVHGYHKTWGYFSGTCPGSRHLPFEQSADLLAQAIGRTLDASARLEAEAQATTDDAEHVWLHEYVPSNGFLKARRVWHKLPVASVEHVHGLVSWVDEQGKRHQMQHAVYGEPWVSGSNKRRVEHVRREIAGLLRYAGWLAERVRDWQPAALLPVA